jgi:hypothetical protein
MHRKGNTSRAGWGIALFGLVLLGGLAKSKPPDSALKKTEFGPAIKVGFGLAQYHDTCLMFRIYFVSGEFFAGLRRSEKGDQPQFRKGNRTHTTFPERTIVNVEATAYGCSDTASRSGQGLLAAPVFVVSRKVGGELRPVTIISTQMRHKLPGPRWDYFLEIPTKDVPLSDELMVDVFLRGRTEHARLSAQLK